MTLSTINRNKTTLLMTCPASYQAGGVDHYRWHLMRSILEVAGATVITPKHSLQRAFVRNQYFQIGNEVFIGQPEKTQCTSASSFVHYGEEVEHYCMQIANRYNLKVHKIITPQMNGGNFLHLPESNTILCGCVDEEDMRKHRKQVTQLNCHVESVQTLVPLYVKADAPKDVSYDIDLFVSRLSHGELLVHKDVIEPQSLELLNEMVGEEQIIFSNSPINCNLMAVGDDQLVLPVVDPVLRQELQQKGYQVIDKKSIHDNPEMEKSVKERMEQYGYNITDDLFNNEYTQHQEMPLHFKANASFKCITNSISSPGQAYEPKSISMIR